MCDVMDGVGEDGDKNDGDGDRLYGMGSDCLFLIRDLLGGAPGRRLNMMT